ncbi:hypothetical protein FACS1894178_1880 [Bacteroidia bacterium]|nr:hypothetical protein FACS1894178_1880 [Bacteroidia bacterium]
MALKIQRLLEKHIQVLYRGVTTTIYNDNGQYVTIGLSGLRVRLREKDPLWYENFGQTYTDENGYYSISYSKSQLAEGGKIELYVYVYSETDNTYDVSAKIGLIQGKDYQFVGNLPQNAGYKTHNFIFNFDSDERNDAFRAAHWANKAFKYFANQNVPLGKGLIIKTHSWGSFTNVYYYNEMFYEPVIRLTSGSGYRENTMYHEFGHYSMYKLQHKNMMIPYGTEGVDPHYWGHENTSLLAWIEGWANAIQMILDAHYWLEDGEFGRDETTDYFEVQIKQSNINNGFRSEYYIANALYDLWDGQYKGLPSQIPNIKYYNSDNSTHFYAHGWNDSTNYSFTPYHKWKTIDDIELSFAQICAPLQTIMTENDLDNLRNIGHYFNILQYQQTNTKTKADIIRCFKENRVIWNISSYNDSIDLGNLTYNMPSQSIEKNEYGCFLKWWIFLFDCFNWTDNYTINPLNSSYDIPIIHFAAYYDAQTALVNDLWIGYKSKNGDISYPKKLKLNAPDNFSPIIRHPNFYTFENREILVRNGVLQLGREDGYYTASLTIDDKSILRIDEYGSLIINDSSSLTINAGGTLSVKSGANVILNGNATITLNPGSFLCIEEGANLNLSSGHIYIDAATNFGINPIYGNAGNCITPCNYDLSGRIITDVLEIPTNTTVNFSNSSIKFAPTAKILVRAGGKLILNGATLTNLCAGEMWQGIELENSENLQSTILEMNNSLIENAVCAVKTIANSSTSKAASVIATNSTFKNNGIALNFGENNPSQNTASTIKSTDFQIDNNYLGSNNVTPNDHILVKLYGTNNKIFSGCNFTVVGAKTWRGIVAEDAGFTVREKCNSGNYNVCDDCPTSYTRSYFSGFDKAIDVNNAGNQVAFKVKRTYFAANNTRAINVVSCNNYSVTYSNFDFPEPVIKGTAISCYGIYSQNASGYTISDNTFYQILSNQGNSNTGIVMKNSGISNNRIHFNQFENMDLGVYVLQTNGASNGTSGLTIVCNDFIGGKYDIVLERATIHPEQGNASSGANNSFVGTQTSSIYSTGNQQINYYYKNAAPFIPYNPSTAYIRLQPTTTTLASNCRQANCLIAILPEKSLQQYQQLQNDNEDGVNDLEMLQLSNAAVHALMTDSIEHLKELQQWYSVINTPIAKYSLAETHFALAEYKESERVLAELPAKFKFEEDEKKEHENYMRFYHFTKKLTNSNRSFDKLSESEILELETIASATTGRSATMAQGVLCFFYGICFEEEEMIEDIGDKGNPEYSQQNAPQQNQPTPTIATISTTPTTPTTPVIYPNPTNGMIYFDNIEGKIVYLHNEIGMLLQSTTKNSMDLSNYPNGNYYLKIDNQSIKVVKK